MFASIAALLVGLIGPANAAAIEAPSASVVTTASAAVTAVDNAAEDTVSPSSLATTASAAVTAVDNTAEDTVSPSSLATTASASKVAASDQPDDPNVKVVKSKAKAKAKKFIRCLSRAAKRAAPTRPADPRTLCGGEMLKIFRLIAKAFCGPGYMGGSARGSLVLKQKDIWEAFAETLEAGNTSASAETIINMAAKGKVSASTTCHRIIPPPPVMITVCELSSKQIVTIDEKAFDAARYSRNLADCTSTPPPVLITVCELSSKQIVTIDEKAFDAARYSRNLADCEPGSIVSLEQPNDVVWCNARTIEVRGRVPDGQVGVLQITAQIGTVSFNPLSCGANDQVAVKKQNVTGEFAVKFWYLAPTEGASDTVKVYLFSKGGVKEDEASVSFGLTKPPVDPKKVDK